MNKKVDKCMLFRQVYLTFVPDCLKYESMFCGLIFDSDEFLGSGIALRAKSFVYE